MIVALGEDPFFHQRSTHNLIDDLSSLSAVTLYIGAGASIERTGLTWAGLSAQLLEKDLGTYAERIAIVRSQSELASSSAIERQFARTHADDPRGALVQAIRDEFYSGPRVQPSYFNERVIAFANDLIGAGQSVVVVTPNYDDFLFDAVREIAKNGQASFKDVQFFGFGMASSGKKATPLQPQLKTLQNSLGNAQTLNIVYIHGFVSRHSDASIPSPLKGSFSDSLAAGSAALHAVQPVFSERDYSLTRTNSERVLYALFSDRDVLVLGSSLTDPPLLQALSTSHEHNVRTKRSVQRFAVRPLQGIDFSHLDESVFASFRHVEDERAEHLGLRLVSPPFYFQAPQILEEARVGVALRRATNARARFYSDSGSTPRYGFRLNEWWREWNEDDDYPLTERQLDSYLFLADIALETIRDILGCPDDEDLRVEAWIRWEPSQRELRLWASSTGHWPDTVTARHEPIGLDSRYPSTFAFLNGAPTYTDGDEKLTRWKSFLSKPIRYMDSSYHSYIPVGVISIASMRNQAEGSLNPRYKDGILDLVKFLDLVGAVLFFPEFKTNLRQAGLSGTLDLGDIQKLLATLQS